MADMETQKTSTPVPDPTLLTTQQLIREIESLRSEMLVRVDSVRSENAARFLAIDEAVKLFRELVSSISVRTDEKIEALDAVMEEKFEGIKTQFEEREVRGANETRDSKLAIDAAFAAADKAVQKSETTFIKQFDSIGALITTATKALEGQIADAKDRLTRIEGQSSGRDTGMGIGWSAILGVGQIISVAIAVVALILTFKAG
jgi:hypothetical protein